MDAFDFDDEVISRIAALQLFMEIFFYRANRNIVHVFDAGRDDALL